jgi:hypothetical protein
MITSINDMFTFLLMILIEIVPMRSTELSMQMRLKAADLVSNVAEGPILVMGLMQFGILMAI